MRQIEYSGQFKRDLKRIKKRGKDMHKIRVPMELLIEGEDLPEKFLDHPLKGNWKGCRDLHIVVVKFFWPRNSSHSSSFPPQHLVLFQHCVGAV